jgi:hypothetical protein
MRTSLAFLLAPLVAVATTADSFAAADAASSVEQHLQQIFAECRVQLELGDSECQCVIDGLPAELDPLEIEYVTVRITGNDAEVERLRQTLHFPQRIGILLTVTQIMQDCAGDMPIRNPL